MRRLPRLAITTDRRATNTALAITTLELTAGGRLTPPPKRSRWRPWAWAAAALLHALIIALCLITWKAKPPAENDSPPGVSVVFDNGGSQQTAAPPAPFKGPSTPAETPPPAALPPPPQVAQTQPEVNLNLPLTPFAPLPQEVAPPSPPQIQPQPHPQPRPAPRPQPTQKYTVMNDMSFGTPAPPFPNAKKGLNLSLPQSDAQAVNAPDLTVKGDVGADWQAALNQWVNDHKYYPNAAVAQGQQGDVTIHFTVDRNGNVTGLRMVRGSGSPFLDQAWLGLFQGNQLPPFPPGTKADNVTVDATMHFELIQ